MDEVVVDGITYVRLYYPSFAAEGDPAVFWGNFDEKEREEIRRKMMEHLVEVGFFMRKEDYERKRSIYEKEHSIYEKDELFYGL
jgi:hypothetical protein